MKKLLLSLLLIIPLVGLSQTIGYKFKFSEATNIGHAKIVIEILRKEFVVQSTFNESTNVFTVPSTQYLNENDLRNRLLPHGYTLTVFTQPQEK